ncbi:MAG TPA: abortive infection family protein [Acidimicrobiia bacterium]
MKSVVADQIGQLEAVRRALPTKRHVGGPAIEVHLDELRLSGLLPTKLVSEYEHRLSTIGTLRGRRAAIGAAKELLESVLKASLKVLGEPTPSKKTDLPTLAKLTRFAIAQRGAIAPTSSGANHLERYLGASTSFLAEWRNEFGTGHGRSSAPNLERRHAQVAIDTATSMSRLIVSTLDDLKLLPPTP